MWPSLDLDIACKHCKNPIQRFVGFVVAAAVVLLVVSR